MCRAFPPAALALFVLASAGPLPAAPVPPDHSPLAVLPATLPIVVQIRGFEGVKERANAVLKKALPEVASSIESLIDKEVSADRFFEEHRKLRGVPRNGPVFFFFSEFPKPGVAERKGGFVVAVTNYEQFRDNLLKEGERKGLRDVPDGYQVTKAENGSSLFFVDKKGYAVVTPFQEVAELFVKQYQGLYQRLNKELTTKLLAGDITAYLDAEALNRNLGSEIQTLKGQLRDALQGLSQPTDKRIKSNLDTAREMVDSAFQAVEDSRAIVLSAEFRPGGLLVHLESELKPDTRTAKVLAGSKLSTFKELDALPGGQVFYTGLELSGPFAAALRGLLFGAMPDADTKEAKAVRAAIDELVHTGPGTRVDAYGLPQRGLQVARFSDPLKAVTAEAKLVRSLLGGMRYGNGVLKEPPIVTADAKKFGGFALTAVELRWDLEKTAEGFGGGAVPTDEMKKQLAEGLKKLIGERQTAWFGTDGKLLVEVTAPDWPAAEKLLKEYFEGANTAGQVASYRGARAELPAAASFLALVDVVRYAAGVLELAKPLIENAIPIPVKLPSPPKGVPPTYSGLAVTLKPDRISVDVFVSADTAHEFFKAFVQPLMEAVAR